MAQPPAETISSYLRRLGPPFHCSYKVDGNQTTNLQWYKWQDIKAIKDWDAFNRSPVQTKFWALLYEVQHHSLLQPRVPIVNTMIASELQLQVSLHIGLLAKVNLALEAITQPLEETTKGKKYEKIQNLGVLPGVTFNDAIPDLVVQDINKLRAAELPIDQGKDEAQKGQEVEEEDIYGSDSGQPLPSTPARRTSNSKRNNLTKRGVATSNTSEPEEEGGEEEEGGRKDRSIHSSPPLVTTLPERSTISLVGEIKLYTRWRHSMWKHTDEHRRKFRQVLSQLNFYMTVHALQYGFVITEKEFVAVYRPGRNGLLKVSRPFPIRTGTEGSTENDDEGTGSSSAQNDGEETSSSSAQRDLCAEEALLALILWAADPPSPDDDATDDTGDADEDEYYPNENIEPPSSEAVTSEDATSEYQLSDRDKRRQGRDSSSPHSSCSSLDSHDSLSLPELPRSSLPSLPVRRNTRRNQ